MKTLRRIVLAHDGSKGASRALEWTGGLARQTGAEVVVVHAYSPLDEVGRHEPPHELGRLRDEAEARLRDEWCADLAAAKIAFDTRLVEDLPVAAVVSVADEIDADLIVCGTRGLGGVKGLVLGSVATELPRKSHRPVAIIPPR
jgi:nucleotide-binding universal stress UspA family protein